MQKRPSTWAKLKWVIESLKSCKPDRLIPTTALQEELVRLIKKDDKNLYTWALLDAGDKSVNKDSYVL